MPVTILLTALLIAQQPPAPADPAQDAARTAIQAKAQAFSACIRGKVMAVPASLTPEQGADSVLAACKVEQTALEQAAEAQIATAPADRQADARQRVKDGMARARTGIADGIRQMRAATPLPSPPKPN